MPLSGETVITLIGNLTSDPELRFTPSGAAVANFTIASTPRTFDKAANEWRDGDTLFIRCAIWRAAAENVAASLTKGARVIAQGRLKQRQFEKDGVTRTVVELDVEDIGPSLLRATATVTKANGTSTPQRPQQHAADPWATTPVQQPPQAQQRPVSNYRDEPPF